MSISEPHDMPVDRIPLGVVTAREKVEGNRWIDERWRVTGVVAGQAVANATIQRAVLRSVPGSEQYLWTGFTLRLRPSEADSYYYNIVGQNPSIYVYCERDDSGEPCPRAVTAEYIEAMAHAEAGNATFAVPMPPEVYRVVERYVLEHYVPEEPRMKRKHERDAKHAGTGDDE